VIKMTKQGSFFRKNVITWKFALQGEKFRIMLKHSPVGGKREIIVHKTKLYSGKTMGSSQHPLKIGKKADIPINVVIDHGIIGVEYDLFIHGIPFTSAEKQYSGRKITTAERKKSQTPDASSSKQSFFSFSSSSDNNNNNNNNKKKK